MRWRDLGSVTAADFSAGKMSFVADVVAKKTEKRTLTGIRICFTRVRPKSGGVVRVVAGLKG